MINRQATALTLTAISILFSSAAFADNAVGTDKARSADMHVNLTVEKSCQISVDDMNFGSRASDSGDATASANATVTCTTCTSYNLSSEKSHDYNMSNNNGTDKVAYALYSDADDTNELSTTGIPQTGTGTAQVIPIYGKVTADALSQAPPGVYADTVTLTVSY